MRPAPKGVAIARQRHRNLVRLRAELAETRARLAAREAELDAVRGRNVREPERPRVRLPEDRP